MKAQKITYWISTSIFSAMMLFSSYAYFTSPDVKAGFEHLGFPSYFRVELGIAKFIGVILLLLPVVKGRLKEWAYAGFGITVISAFIAHFVAGDPVANWVSPLVMLAILAVSNIYYHRLQAGK
jgi:VIT1/CCC1 family predicted Fe2+/Mn2+ transporter